MKRWHTLLAPILFSSVLIGALTGCYDVKSDGQGKVYKTNRLTGKTVVMRGASEWPVTSEANNTVESGPSLKEKAMGMASQARALGAPALVILECIGGILVCCVCSVFTTFLFVIKLESVPAKWGIHKKSLAALQNAMAGIIFASIIFNLCCWYAAYLELIPLLVRLRNDHEFQFVAVLLCGAIVNVVAIILFVLCSSVYYRIRNEKRVR